MHLAQLLQQLVDILVNDWKKRLQEAQKPNQDDDSQASKSIQSIISSMNKLFSIVKAEGKDELLSGVFREALRHLANEIDTTYLKVNGANLERVKTDLLAILEAVQALEVD